MRPPSVVYLLKQGTYAEGNVMNNATRNSWIVVLCLGLAALMGAALAEDSADSEHEAVAEASDEMDLVVVEEAPPEAQEEQAEAKPSKTAVWLRCSSAVGSPCAGSRTC